MNKTAAIILLAVFGNLLIFTVGIVQILLLPLAMSIPMIVAIFVFHIIAARFSSRRFRRKYGISAGRYILYGALPAVLINIAAFAVITVLMGSGFDKFPLWSIDFVPIEWVLAFFSAGYSIVYIIIIAVVLQSGKIWSEQ